MTRPYNVDEMNLQLYVNSFMQLYTYDMDCIILGALACLLCPISKDYLSTLVIWCPKDCVNPPPCPAVIIHTPRCIIKYKHIFIFEYLEI